MTWAIGLLTEPVAVVSATRADDDYGPEAPDWDATSGYETVARLQPAGGSESLVNVDVQQGDLLAYLPPGTPIDGRDRVVVAGGLVYQVIGPPDRWRSPWSATEHHVRALLRRVERAGVPTSGERDAEVTP